MGKGTISITFKMDGDEKSFQALVKNANGLSAALKGSMKQADQLHASLINFTQLSKAFDNIGRAVQNLSGITGEYVAAFRAQEEAETKLATVMRERMGATADVVQKVKDLTAAQQQLGVIGDEIQLAGAQQIATFLKESSSLDALIPAMNDLVAQQKGLNATQADAVSVANLMGKAMSGQTSALTRVGIVFSDAQKQILQYGSESEKAATLAEVITQNVGHMNSELAKTDSGKVKQLENTLGDLNESIGKAIVPYQTLINLAAQMAMIASSFGMLSSAFKAIGASALAVNRQLLAVIATTRLGRVTMLTWNAVCTVTSQVMRGAAVSAIALKVAIRGLMVATGVGAAIAALTTALNYFLDKADDAEKTTGKLQNATTSYSTSVNTSVADVVGKYQTLQAQWKALSTESQKQTWIKQNQTAFQGLGLSISNVNQANSVFVKNSKNVADALKTIAEATAYSNLYQESVTNLAKFDATHQAVRYKTAKAGTTIGDDTVKQYGLGKGDYSWAGGQSGALRLTEQGAAKIREAEYQKSLKQRNEERQKIAADVTYFGEKMGEAASAASSAAESLNGISSAASTATGKGSTADKGIEVMKTEKRKATTVDLDPNALDNVFSMLAASVGSSLDQMNSLLSAYRQKFAMAQTGDDRLKYKALIEATELRIDQMEHPDKWKIDKNGIAIPLRLETPEIKIGAGFGEDMKKMGDKTDEAKISMQSLSNAASQVGSAVQSIGQATGQKGLTIAGTIAQAIANIALGFSKESIEAAEGGPQAWIPAIAAGLATMISTIATIKSATAGSYANGGIISGAYSHGDMLYARVNAGETILNQNQTGRLWKMLSGNTVATNGVPLSGKVDFNISGRNLRGVLQKQNTLTDRT